MENDLLISKVGHRNRIINKLKGDYQFHFNSTKDSSENKFNDLKKTKTVQENSKNQEENKCIIF